MYSDCDYFLSFNDEKGENVRMTIGADVSDFSQIVSDLHEHLQRFLVKYPAQLNEPSPMENFFMNFPTNSVHYNLYTHMPYMFRHSGGILDMDGFFSDLWKTLAQKTPETLEDLLGNRFIFLFQLTHVLLYCFSSDPEHAHSITRHVLNKNLEKNHISPALVREMEEDYSLYRKDLEELSHETWKRLETGSEELEFSEFKPVFKRLLSSISVLKEDEKFQALSKVMKKMNNDLRTQHILLNYFLSRSIESLHYSLKK